MLLERLGSILLEATGIDRVFINLIDTAQQVLTPKVASGGLIAPDSARIPFSDLSRTSLDAIIAKRTAPRLHELPEVPDRSQIARSNSARLVLFVPLVHVDEVIGHITLDQPGARYEFTREQIRIVESIARQAAVALQNAKLFEREHHVAETLRQALLAPPERIDAIDLAFVYRPASTATRVGGDFYDVIDLDGELVALVVGDVSGKGIRAARLTALMRDGVRAYLLETSDPAECFDRLNALAYRFTPVDKFATGFLAVLNEAPATCATATPRTRPRP